MFNKVNELSMIKSMYYMAVSGISITDAAVEMSQRVKDKKAAEKLSVMAEMMTNEGYTFSDALEQVGLFNNYIPLIRIGEKTGNLFETLNNVINITESIEKVKKKVKASLYYPIGVIVISIFISFGLVSVVKKVLEGLNFPAVRDTLPYRAGMFMVNYKYIIFSVYIIGLIAAFYLAKRFLHLMPIVKDLYSKIQLGQALKMLSLCLSSGMSLSDAFAFLSQSSSGIWARIYESMSEDSKTRSVSEVIEEFEQYMPSEAYIVLRAKIKSGDISRGFDMIGDDFLTTAIQKMDAMSSFITIVSFLIVAGQVIVFMSPVWTVTLTFMTKVSGKGGF